MSGRLVIGTRRYSSWSMRGWLAVRLASLDVAVEVVPLAGGSTPALAGATEAGLVPFLEHDGARVWESLAIVEYCAEHAPLWPQERVARAAARSMAAEMHAGFAPLRAALPMNLGRADAAPAPRPPEVARDIARVQAIWERALAASGGPFLTGAAFGGADAMFAPVVARFLSYAVELQPACRAYASAVRGHPLVAEWYDAAAQEPEAWRLAKYETVA
jgi:glutathione S-transferase